MFLKRMRHSLYLQLNPNVSNDRTLSPLNKVIIALIITSVCVVVIESEPTIYAGRESLFYVLEVTFGSAFLLEYLARVWTCVEGPKYSSGLKGRLRYMATPAALLDLIAVLPLLLYLMGPEAYMLRLVRLLRVIRLAKLGRFSDAVSAIGEAISERKFELLASFLFSVVLLLITSTLMYLVEAEEQPGVFGSIPRAMWWSAITLTTVGYGDSYPVTSAGRVLAALTAVLGIGLIAMPTGILVAAFSNVLQNRRQTRNK
jgi:voltage-gated potassium channel